MQTNNTITKIISSTNILTHSSVINRIRSSINIHIIIISHIIINTNFITIDTIDQQLDIRGNATSRNGSGTSSWHEIIWKGHICSWKTSSLEIKKAKSGHNRYGTMVKFWFKIFYVWVICMLYIQFVIRGRLSQSESKLNLPQLLFDNINSQKIQKRIQGEQVDHNKLKS